MPAFANLSLKNQAAVEQVFAPANIDPSTKISTWLATGASFDGKPRATLSLNLPKSGSTRVKIVGKVTVPIMDLVETTKKTDELIGTFEFSLPKNAALATRQDLRAMLADFVTDAVTVAAVENFESVY